MNELSAAIRDGRKRRGWTQTELAERLPGTKVHQTCISHWEKGRCRPSWDKMMVLQTLFGWSDNFVLRNAKNDLPHPLKTLREQPLENVVALRSYLESAARHTTSDLRGMILLTVLGHVRQEIRYRTKLLKSEREKLKEIEEKDSPGSAVDSDDLEELRDTLEGMQQVEPRRVEA